MPEQDDFERRPKMRVVYMEKPSDFGAVPGFQKHGTSKDGKPEAVYCNMGRVQFEHPIPIAPKDAQGQMPRAGAKGGWYMWRVTDYDHGHKMVVFFSERVTKKEDTGEYIYSVPYVVNDLVAHFKEQGLTEENWNHFLFEIGKTAAKGGPQGKWYVRLLSTTANTPGMFDDPAASKFKDTFEMNDSEKAIVKKVNSLVEASGLPKDFSKEMFMTTFVSGAAGPPTTQRRAQTIWEMMKSAPEKTGLHPEIIKYVQKVDK